MSDKQEWTDFRAAFDRILSKLSPVENSQEFIQTFEWLQRMLRYNVPHGKCNRGMAVVETYRLLAEQQNRVPNEEELEMARVLGWNVEFLQGYFLIVDDIMDSSITRRGQPCWYRQEDVGLIACNDAIMLDQENYHILKMYLAKHPQYLNIFEALHQVARYTTYGQSMDVSSNPPGKGPQFALFTRSRYNTINKYKTAFYSFVLPVRLAMYLSSMTDPTDHKSAEEVLLKIGHLFQVQDDFLDCWGDPAIMGKIGTDIEEGKCCWPIVTAFELCNESQSKSLKENYAKKDGDAVRRVKAIYNELGLKEVFLKEEEKQYEQICQEIDALKTKCQLNPKIFRQFLEKIYKRQK